MSDTIFTILWAATWQSTVLALFILLLIFLLGERLAPRFRYLLWCVVLLRLAIPILPATPWGVLPNEKAEERAEATQITVPNQQYESIANPFPQRTPPPFNPNTVVSFQKPPAVYAVPETPQPVEPAPPGTAGVPPAFFACAKVGVVLVWMLGIAVFAARYIDDEIRLYRKSRYWKPIDDPKLLSLFESCRQQLGIRRSIQWMSVSHGIGAASSGTICPKVLLSQEILEQTVSETASETEIQKLRMVVLHELMHIKRFDPLVLRIALILSVIHWLNPVVRLVMSRLQRDRELACDAAVLHKLESNHVHEMRKTVRKTYGEAVLAFAAHAAQQEQLPGLVGLFPKHAIARRIEMILNYKKTNLLFAVFGTLLVLTVAAFGLTRASQKDDTTPLTNTTTSTNTTSTREQVKVSGRVTGPNGKPVEGALLVWQTETNDYWKNREKAVKTNKDGFYESPELKAMPGTITVLAEGFAPDMKQVEFKAGMQTVDFSLKPGKTLEIRFVDRDGKPVPGVRLAMGGNPDPWWRKDSNIYNKSFYCEEAMKKGILPDSKIPYVADENGVYRWTWAPEDKVRFIFRKEGYMDIWTDAYRSGPYDWLVPGEKYQIVMQKTVVVTGTVVDDETGKPITEYKTVPGNIQKNYSPGGIMWQTGQGEEFKDGQFEHTFKYANEEGYRIRIDAEGYESFVSEDIIPGNTIPQLNIRLKKYMGLSGTVLLSDGTPAAGTKIYVSGDGGYLQVTNPPESSLLAGRTDRLTTTADQNGKFTIYQQPDARFGMYLEHPQGLTWVKSGDFVKNREIRLRGFAKNLSVVLPTEYRSGREVHFTLWVGPGGDGFGHISYSKDISPTTKSYDFEKIVAGKHRLTIWERSPDHEWVRGSMAFESLKISFEIKEGETKTLDLDVPGATITGKIKLPDTVKEQFTERDWSYNRIELQTTEGNDRPSKMAVSLKKSKEEPQTGTFQFNHVPSGPCSLTVWIFKAPKDSTTMDAGFDACLAQFAGQIDVPEEAKLIEMPSLTRVVSLQDETDVLVFDGQWKNEKTGEVIPTGTIVEGTRGAFRLEKIGEEGKVVKTFGDGTEGQGKYIAISQGGNKIAVSRLSPDELKELESKIIPITMDDVFVFDEGQWKNEKTGDVIPEGTPVNGTSGLFRLEQKNGEGKITTIAGGGATGQGKYIRWSHGGNALSGSKP